MKGLESQSGLLTWSPAWLPENVPSNLAEPGMVKTTDLDRT